MGLRLRMKNFNIIGVHWKILFFRGCMKKATFGGASPKKGGLDSLHFKRRLDKKEGVMFLRGEGETPMHTELEEPSYWHKYPKQITLSHSVTNNNINYSWNIVPTYLKKKKKKVWLLTPKIPISRLTKVWNCGVKK